MFDWRDHYPSRRAMVYDLVPFVLPVALVLIVLMVAVDAIVHAF